MLLFRFILVDRPFLQLAMFSDFHRWKSFRKRPVAAWGGCDRPVGWDIRRAERRGLNLMLASSVGWPGGQVSRMNRGRDVNC